MDLKIKDVADLLNVPEKTVLRLLEEGKIPGYRIKDQYRFSRDQIQDWLTTQKLGITTSLNDPTSKEEGVQLSGGSKQYCLYRAIHNGGVYSQVPGNTKEELIRNAMSLIARDLGLDADVLSELFLEREQLQSTALNNGIAVPHTRDFLLNSHQDVVAIVFPEKPIAFGALDGKPVHTLFFLFASDDKRHLHLLAKIAHLSSQDSSLNLLQKQPTKEKVLEFIKSWEGSIQKLLKEED